MIIIKHFAERIKKARKEAGISQEKAAELLKTSQSNISKYENGVLEPNLDTIKMMIALYNIDVKDLFSKTEEDTKHK